MSGPRRRRLSAAAPIALAVAQVALASTATSAAAAPPSSSSSSSSSPTGEGGVSPMSSSPMSMFAAATGDGADVASSWLASSAFIGGSGGGGGSSSSSSGGGGGGGGSSASAGLRPGRVLSIDWESLPDDWLEGVQSSEPNWWHASTVGLFLVVIVASFLCVFCWPKSCRRRKRREDEDQGRADAVAEGQPKAQTPAPTQREEQSRSLPPLPPVATSSSVVQPSELLPKDDEAAEMPGTLRRLQAPGPPQAHVLRKDARSATVTSVPDGRQQKSLMDQRPPTSTWLESPALGEGSKMPRTPRTTQSSVESLGNVSTDAPNSEAVRWLASPRTAREQPSPLTASGACPSAGARPGPSPSASSSPGVALPTFGASASPGAPAGGPGAPPADPGGPGAPTAPGAPGTPAGPGGPGGPGALPAAPGASAAPMSPRASEWLNSPRPGARGAAGGALAGGAALPPLAPRPPPSLGSAAGAALPAEPLRPAAALPPALGSQRAAVEASAGSLHRMRSPDLVAPSPQPRAPSPTGYRSRSAAPPAVPLQVGGIAGLMSPHFAGDQASSPEVSSQPAGFVLGTPALLAHEMPRYPPGSHRQELLVDSGDGEEDSAGGAGGATDQSAAQTAFEDDFDEDVGFVQHDPQTDRLLLPRGLEFEPRRYTLDVIDHPTASFSSSSAAARALSKVAAALETFGCRGEIVRCRDLAQQASSVEHERWLRRLEMNRAYKIVEALAERGVKAELTARVVESESPGMFIQLLAPHGVGTDASPVRQPSGFSGFSPSGLMRKSLPKVGGSRLSRTFSTRIASLARTRNGAAQADEEEIDNARHLHQQQVRQQPRSPSRERPRRKHQAHERQEQELDRRAQAPTLSSSSMTLDMHGDEASEQQRKAKGWRATCPYDGCGRRGLLAEVAEHVRLCEHRPAQCTNDGCKEEVKFKDLDVHRVHCQHRLMLCPFEGCRAEVKCTELDAHRVRCQHRLVLCPFEGCRAEVQACFLRSHQEACLTARGNVAYDAQRSRVIVLRGLEFTSPDDGSGFGYGPGLGAGPGRSSAELGISFRYPDAAKRTLDDAAALLSVLGALGVEVCVRGSMDMNAAYARWLEDLARRHRAEAIAGQLSARGIRAAAAPPATSSGAEWASDDSRGIFLNLRFQN